MKRLCRKSHGHTLIELVIAMALGLMVTAGAVSLYRTQRAALSRAGDSMQMRDAGLTALTMIGQQLQLAGFFPADAQQSDRPAPLFGCSGGHPAGGDSSLNCETLASHSDGVAIRYVGDNVSTWPSASAQSTDCLGQAVTNVSAALSGKGVLIVNRYFAKSSGSTGEPELYCEGSGKPGSAQPLVEGVERVRLKYWIAGAPTALDASAVMAAQWFKVVAVDLCVLVRGAPQGRRFAYVDCDGANALGADMRARQSFSRRVAIRNNEGDR
jgi:type IV pilus assembly protein PilW